MDKPVNTTDAAADARATTTAASRPTPSGERLALPYEPNARSGPRNPESLSSLFADLWRQTTTLIQQEAALAKAEASEKVSQVAIGAGTIAAGGAVLFAGFIILLMALVNALAPFLPPRMAPWLAPAIVGIVVLIIGFIMASGGIKAMQAQNLKPTRTVESLRRTGDMVKEHV